MHKPLAGFCRPSIGKIPLKECASFQSIPFRIIQGKSWAPTLYCNSNAQLLMRTGGVTKIILCADHFYNKIIACFCAILRIYAPSLEGSKDAFRHELIVFQTSKLAEKAPIQRASCLGSRQDSDCTKNSHFQKMHEPLAGFCRPSFGKFPLKECASFQSIPFRIIQGKSWAPTLYCNSNAQKSWGR